MHVTTFLRVDLEPVTPAPPDDRTWDLVSTAATERDSGGAKTTWIYYTWKLRELDLQGHPGPWGPRRT